MPILSTARLTVREITLDDAAFIVELLNDPDFVRFVGDREVRDVAQARAYLERGALAHFARHGFGGYVARLQSDGTPVGMCSLLRRDTLPDVDIGYAFLAQYRGQGYALEASREILRHAREDLGIARVIAITTVDHDRSANLLEKLGLSFERMIEMEGDTEPLRLFGIG